MIMDNQKKEKPIFVEGEYVVANDSMLRFKRGMIGFIEKICGADFGDQLVEVSFPHYSDYLDDVRGSRYSGMIMMTQTNVWCSFLEHLPDRAADSMDIATINSHIMHDHTIGIGMGKSFAQSINDRILRDRIIREASTESLIFELKNRKEISELEPLEAEKIIFNYPATIVFWSDGTKTVVKCSKGQEFSEYYGFLAAWAKKMFGTNSAINRLIKNKREYGDQHFDPDQIQKVMPKKTPSIDISINHEDLEEIFSGDCDGDGFDCPLRYDYDPKFGFDIEFNKRRKANEFYNTLESIIKSGEGYTVKQLLSIKTEATGDWSAFQNYGWNSMDGIYVQKLAPNRWKVIFPPAKFFGNG